MNTTTTVEINCDMGEGFGLYKLGDDQALLPYIDVANVACGFHASDPTIMRRIVGQAKEAGVRVGAHPSLPDLQGFGRREMKIAAQDLTALVLYQVGALSGFLRAEGMALNHIKPHGALYGMAAKDERIAGAICDVAEIFGVPLMGSRGTLHEEVCRLRGIPLIAEFYIDLDYSGAGELIITQTHDARDPEQAAARALRAIESHRVRSTDGADLPIQAQSLCIHSDTPNAVEIARAVVRALRPHLATKAGRFPMG
ncbi:MAG TPA: 5-oxoprolinase subunit PxpA [Steroidobacteraceae bacterium]